MKRLSMFSAVASNPLTSADQPQPPSHGQAIQAARLALEKGAGSPVILDLREFSFLCDYYVIVDGKSAPQVRAIVEHIEQGLGATGEKPWHIEGLEGKQWVLLDYVDFVVHVFREDTRELYMLERLWADAPKEVVDAGVESP